MDNSIQRQCLDCKDFFPPTSEYFHNSPRGRDGLASYCKPCAHKRTKANKYKPENIEKTRARGRAHYHAHKEHYLVQHKQWYEANREYALEKDRQFRIDHPEILAERWQHWYQTENGKEHSRLRVRNRYARRKGAQGNYTYADIQRIFKAQKSKCYYCHDVLEQYHIDHIVPIIRGGSNEPSNLVLTCPSCNLSKGTKLLHEWTQGNRLL